MQRRNIIRNIVVILIFTISLVNIIIIPTGQQVQSAAESLPTAVVQLRNVLSVDEACQHGLPEQYYQSDAPFGIHGGYGSVAKTILKKHPIIHNSCFFLPTISASVDQHKHLLQLYPNSYLVVSEMGDGTRIEGRTIYINGTDEYDLLWHKTKGLWDLVSQQMHTTFRHCQWFFKVDSDTFLNLHLIEQMLATYKVNENHYIGWFNPGNLNGRDHIKWGRVKVAIGAFYGFTRSIMLHWEKWQAQNIFPWGLRYYGGEDANVAMFLRDHGVCLEVPSSDAQAFGTRSGVWGGFENITPPVSNGVTQQCIERVKSLMDNECFVHGHKVPLQWMPILVEVMKSHASSDTVCELVSNEGSIVVNGTLYHRILDDLNEESECDPCLLNQKTLSCSGWKQL